jgi:hypothetical protein
MYGEVEPSKYGAKNGNVRTLRRGRNGCRAADLRNIDRAPSIAWIGLAPET